jgi:hypothetical protein
MVAEVVRRAWLGFLRVEPWIASVVAATLTVAAYFVTDLFLAIGLTLLTLIVFNQYRSFAQDRTERSVEVLPDALVGGRLREMLRSADQWYFRGGTGSFLRTETLPRLAEKSRRSGRRIAVRVELINPSNDESCAAYVNYRAAADPYAKSSGREWTMRYVQCEVAASIVAAALHAGKSQLSVSFAFSDVSNALRYDMSDDEVVITSAYKNFPALAVQASCPLFSSFVTDLDLSFETAPIRLDVNAAVSGAVLSGSGADAVAAVLGAIPPGLLPDDFTQPELAAIADRAGLPEAKK